MRPTISQLVESLTVNQKVACSSQARGKVLVDQR